MGRDSGDIDTFAGGNQLAPVLAAAVGLLVNGQLPSQLDAASVALSRDALATSVMDPRDSWEGLQALQNLPEHQVWVIAVCSSILPSWAVRDSPLSLTIHIFCSSANSEAGRQLVVPQLPTMGF
jgi:hypothetical protein